MRYFRPLAAAATLALLTACQDDSVSVETLQLSPGSMPEGFLAHGQVRTGYVTGEDGQPQQVTFEVIDGRAIFEGDIELGPADQIARTAEQLLAWRAEGVRRGPARDGSYARWPGGVVPIVVSSDLPSPERVYDAVRYIEYYTDVDFVSRTSQSDYIYIVPSSGCSSSVGRVGGVQYIRLASGCSTGSTAHEFLHALGMYHEQGRCDRDSYVSIEWNNIQGGKEHNFNRQCSGATDYSYYDEGSLMHYSRTAFSSNGLPTIRSKRGRDSEMGQRSRMSDSDIRTINVLY